MKIRLGEAALTGSAIGIVFLMLLSSSVSALELGTATVRSALGERLLVEVPLSDAELAAPNCFTATVDGMRLPLGMRKTRSMLLLSTPRIVVEPLLSLTVTVSCANIASIQRQYTLFLDPATRRPVETAMLFPVRERPAPARATRATRPAGIDINPLPGQGYTVQIGDTVSELAETIASDGQSIWPIVDQIVADNPTAFLDGDADKLIAGAVLVLRGSTGPNGGARVDSTPDTTNGTGRMLESREAASSQQTLAQQQSRPADAARSANGSETAQILSVLQGNSDTPQTTTLSDESTAETDSPFKPVEQVSQSSDAAVIAPAAAAVSQGSGTSWLTRVLALIGGMALAISAWIIWQIVAGNAARRRRQQEYSVPLSPTPHFPAQREPEYSTAKPAAYAETIEISPPKRSPADEDYEVAFHEDDDDETFSFHTTAPRDEPSENPAAEPVAVKRTSAPENDEFEVEALESIGMTTIMRGLDEQTQKLLEQDYETELTHTQQIRRDVAERALKLNAGARVADEPTEEMHVLDETSEMLAADELDVTLDMAGVKEAAFVATPADDNATMPMSLDLDIDDPSVSVVLRESADMLQEALKDFDVDGDLEEPAPAAKRQA